MILTFAGRANGLTIGRLAAIPLGGYVRFAGDAEGSSSVPDAEDLADLKRQMEEMQAKLARLAEK
jgi:regulator of sigma E protease